MSEAPTADPVRPGEELAVVRAGPWRLLVPVRHVARVHPAALPVARPSTPSVAPVVAIDGALLPVVFAAALAGEREVRLAAADHLVELAGERGRALLWADAVEDVVEHVPAPAPSGSWAGALVAAWSGDAPPLPVIDVPRLLALAL